MQKSPAKSLARLPEPTRYPIESAADAHPSQWAEWTYTGLQQFEVDDGAISGVATIKRLADMVVESRSITQQHPKTGVYQDRSILVDDNVFYLHGDQLYTGEWGNPNVMDGPRP